MQKAERGEGGASAALDAGYAGDSSVTERTRALAERSVNCVVCQRARRQQAGLLFLIVKTFEGLCPYCRAYEKVYGRKSHEPVPPPPATLQGKAEILKS